MIVLALISSNKQKRKNKKKKKERKKGMPGSFFPFFLIATCAKKSGHAYAQSRHVGSSAVEYHTRHTLLV